MSRTPKVPGDASSLDQVQGRPGRATGQEAAPAGSAEQRAGQRGPQQPGREPGMRGAPGPGDESGGDDPRPDSRGRDADARNPQQPAGKKTASKPVARPAAGGAPDDDDPIPPDRSGA